jgi:hypothetical protein
MLVAQPSNTDWQQKYGDSSRETLFHIIEADNGNVVGVGSSSDKGGNGFLVIADAKTGRPIKAQSYGDNYDDAFYSVVQTWNGNFLLVGKKQTKRVASSNGWIVCVDDQGETLWEREYATKGDDVFKSIVLLADGTAMIAGTPNGAKREDLWMLQINANNGDKIAEKTMGLGFKGIEQLITTADGGYCIIGNTDKGNGRIVKVDARSNLQWNKEFGEKKTYEQVEEVVEADDGGFAIVGSTWAALDKNQDGQNMWLVKMNKYGNLAWQKTFGGRDDDFGHSITRARDGGFVVVGKTKSQSVGARKFDMMVVKVTPDGGLAWNKNYGGGADEQGLASAMSHNGGLIMGGETDSAASGASDAWLIKLSDSFIEPVTDLDLAFSDVKFLDNDNDRLDAGEAAYFEFKVANKGSKPIYDINIETKTSVKVVGLRIWETAHAGDLNPNETRKVRLPVRGGNNLQDGKAQFDFTLFAGGKRNRSLAASLECKGAKPAEMFVAETRFKNGNMPQKGVPEAFSMKLMNIGSAPFNELSAEFTLPEGVEFIQGSTSRMPIGKLEGGATVPIEVFFSIPKNYAQKSFTIQYKILENKGGKRKRKDGPNIVAAASLKTDILDKNDIDASAAAPTMARPSENVTVIWVTPDPSEVDVSNMASEVNYLDVKLKTISGALLSPDMFKVYINGADLNGAKFDEDELRPPTKSNGVVVSTYKNKLPLKKGDNRILVEVSNGSVKSNSEEIMVNLTPQLPNLHVLAIGVSHEDLKYTVKDAEDFAAAFAGQQGRLFNKVFVTKLTTKEQTTDNAIKEAFVDLNQRFTDELAANRINKRDVLVVFISSHGKTNRNRFKILPSNYDKKYGDFDLYVLDFKTDIMDYLDPITCKKLLLIDACHSGAAYAVTGSKAAEDKEISDALARLVAASPGLTTLTSSDRSQLSYEDDRWQNGAFTEAILEAFGGKAAQGMGKADVDNNKILTIKELYDYIKKRVPALVKQFKANAPTDQTPFKPESELDEDIPIYEIKQ